MVPTNTKILLRQLQVPYDSILDEKGFCYLSEKHVVKKLHTLQHVYTSVCIHVLVAEHNF